METQAYLIGAAIVLISAILIYFIAAITMREQSYDDIIREQRQRREAAAPVAAVPVDKKQKKKTKKRIKLDRTDGTDADEQSSDQQVIEEAVPKMVELELEPEIINDSPKPVRSKSKKNKPILHNKDEKSGVKPGMNVEEIIHYRNPKDSVELKREKERKISENKSAPNQEPVETQKHKKDKKEKKDTVDASGQEEVIIAQTKAVTAAAPPPKEQKKSKKPKENAVSAAAGDAVASGDGPRLQAAVQTARLNDADIQSLIEMLLGKQSAAGGKPDNKWKTKSQKGDPVGNLEKQLEEKNQLLTEEKEQFNVATRRIKELQQDLARERHQYSVLETASQEKVNAKVQDYQALQMRLQKSHDQHMAEMNTLRKQIDHNKSQMSDGQVVIIQRLQEEKKQLLDQANNAQTQLKIVQDELKNQIQERTNSDTARKTMESKFAQYEDKMRKVESSQRDNDSRIGQISEQFQREQARCSSLSRDLEKANNERHMRDQELAGLRKMVNDVEERKGHEIISLQNMLQNLREENTTLATELKTCKERTAGEGQESPCKPQGEAQPVMEQLQKTEDSVLRNYHDQIVQQKEEELNQLRSNLEAYAAEKDNISKLTQELEAQKKKNNDLEDGKVKVASNLSAAQQELEATNQQLLQLQQQLSDQATQLDSTSRDMSELQHKNNELQFQCQTLASQAAESTAEDQLLEQLKDQGQQLAEKTQLVHDQLQQIQNKEQLQEQLQQQISDKDRLLQEYQQQLDAKEQEQQNKLEDKESLLQDLTQKLSEKENILIEKLKELEKSNQVQNQAKQIEDYNSATQQQSRETDQQLQELQQQLRDKENDLKQTEETLKQQQQLIDDKKKEVEQKNEELLQRIQEQEMKDKEIEQRSQQLENTDQDIQQRLQQLEQLNQTLEQRAQQKDLDMEQKSQQLEEKNQQLKQQNDEMLAKSQEIQDKEEQLKEKDRELQDYLGQLQQKESSLKQQSDLLDVQQKELHSLKDASVQSMEHSQELDKLHQENEELREKNWKAMDALSQAERAVQEKTVLNEELKQTKDALQKIFPDIQIAQFNSPSWIPSLQQYVTTHIQSTQLQVEPPVSQLESQLSESEEMNSKLEIQVQHYKTVLADTESILNKLQSSVESEEQKWQQMLHKQKQKSDDDINKIRAENQQLSEEIKTLQSHPDGLANGTPLNQEVDELRSQLSSTQKQLEQEVQANKQLTQKLGVSVENESSSV